MEEEHVNVLDSSALAHPLQADTTKVRILTMDEYLLQKAADSKSLPPSTAARIHRVQSILANPLILMSMAESGGQTLARVRWRLVRLLDPNVDDSVEAEEREWDFIMNHSRE